MRMYWPRKYDMLGNSVVGLLYNMQKFLQLIKQCVELLFDDIIGYIQGRFMSKILPSVRAFKGVS